MISIRRKFSFHSGFRNHSPNGFQILQILNFNCFNTKRVYTVNSTVVTSRVTISPAVLLLQFRNYRVLA